MLLAHKNASENGLEVGCSHTSKRRRYKMWTVMMKRRHGERRSNFPRSNVPDYRDRDVECDAPMCHLYGAGVAAGLLAGGMHALGVVVHYIAAKYKLVS